MAKGITPDQGKRPEEIAAVPNMAVSPYRDMDFTRDSVKELKRHGFKPELAVAIVKHPHWTERAEDGAVISGFRNGYGMIFEVEHEPQREEMGEGVPAILDTTIRQFRVRFPSGKLV